jgi:uncharacterized protein (TIGR00251 family)
LAQSPWLWVEVPVAAVKVTTNRPLNKTKYQDNRLSESIQRNRLNLKVTPNAGRNEITGYSGGILHVKIAAPPVQGRANKELIEFFSQSLGVSKSSITIVKGQTSRSKVIAVQGLAHDEVISRLAIKNREGA